jgi:hypothetical protein
VSVSSQVLARLLSGIRREGECWIWTRGVGSKGYARAKIGGRMRYVHHVLYEVYVGPLPPGTIHRHKCDTPRCVNPAHILPGTHQDNMDDMVSRNRQARGEQHGRVKLTDRQVAEIRERREAGESQCSLASAFGMAQKSISRIVRGESR